MRCLRPVDDDRGSVTAEFAVVLPAVLLCLALCLGAVQAAAQQVRLVDTAASAARLLGRGDDVGDAVHGADVQLESERSNGMVCVRATAAVGIAVLGSLGINSSARCCALDESAGQGAG